MNCFSSPESQDIKRMSAFSRVLSNILCGIKTTPRSSKRLYLAQKFLRSYNEDQIQDSIPKDSIVSSHGDTDYSLPSHVSCSSSSDNAPTNFDKSSCCSDSTRGYSTSSDRTSTSSECGTLETVFTDDFCYIDCDSSRSTFFQTNYNCICPSSNSEFSSFRSSISSSTHPSQHVLHINKSTKQQIILSKLMLPSLNPDPATIIGWYKNKHGEIVYITTQDPDTYLSNSSSSLRRRRHQQPLESRYPSFNEYFYISTKKGQLIGMPTLDLSTCGLPSYSYHLYKRKRPTYNTSY